MASVRSVARSRHLVLAALGAASLLVVPARTARANSCYPPPPEPVVPSTTESLESEDDVPASAPVPTDVRPRVIMRSENCSGLDPDARLHVLGPLGSSGDDEVPGETVRTTGPGWAVLELELAAPLEPSSTYKLCTDEGMFACVSFQTLDGPAPPPTAPVLTIGEPDSAEGDDGLVVSVQAETTWSPFVGTVWLEARPQRAATLPLIIASDAQATTEDRSFVDARAEVGDEVCVVAVARGANGTIAESEPACFDAQPPPDSGCALGGPPGSPTSSAAAALAALALAGGARRRFRRRR